MESSHGLPLNVLALITQLSEVNRTLSENARTMCGRRLEMREVGNLDAMLTIRQSLLNQLESLGYKVADGSNVWRPAPDTGLAAALELVFG